MIDDIFSEIIKAQKDLESSLEITRLKEIPIYQTSTYIPTYLGGTTPGVTTYTLQAGFWKKINNIVFFRGIVVWTAATGTGNAQISLPFVNSNTTGNEYTSGSLRLTGVTFANSTPQMLINPNVSYFLMDSPLTNANPTTVQIEAAGNVVFSGIYFT